MVDNSRFEVQIFGLNPTWKLQTIISCPRFWKMALISIVIPAYNEKNRIHHTLESLIGFLKKSRLPFDFEFIIVVDGKDSTDKVIMSFIRKTKFSYDVFVPENEDFTLSRGEKREGQFLLLLFPHRLGKGGGLMKGFQAAKGEIVFMIDADGAVPPSEMLKLLNLLEEADIAIASRYAPGSKAKIPMTRVFFAKVFNLMVNILFSLGFDDTQCGFKAFKAKALKIILPLIKTTNFAWDVDMLVQAKKAGLKVEEVAVTYNAQKGGSITLTNGLQTALKMFVTILKIKFRGN